MGNFKEDQARKRGDSLDSADDASQKFTFEISANDERGILTSGGTRMANHSYCSRVHVGEIVSCQTYGTIKLSEDVVLCPRKWRTRELYCLYERCEIRGFPLVHSAVSLRFASRAINVLLCLLPQLFFIAGVTLF